MAGNALEGVQLHLVNSFDKLAECWRWMGERREGPLCADTESAGLSPYRDRHRFTQIGDMRHGWAFPAQGWGGAAAELISRYQGPLGMHNSPYDWRVLKIHSGMEPQWARTHDSLLGGHLMHSLRLAGLKERSAVEIDPRAMAGQDVLNEGMRAQHWTWDTVPDTWEPYFCYAALDPVLTAHLLNKWMPELTTTYRELYDTERATARICANMMDAGLMIDVPFVQEKISALLAYREKAMAWLRSSYGITSVNSNEQVGRALNLAGIPTQMWTAGGKPAIDKDSLKFYATVYPEQAGLVRAIATCRKTGDLVGKYLQKFLDLRGADDIMHYSIWSCRARTSRMSITDPPMQTFDRDEPAVRGAFIPRPGHVFITIDADQIEGRMTAHASGDERMIADFLHADQTGQKFFIIMASRIYSEDIAKSDPRYTWTKNATYAQIYGSGLDRAAVTAGVPLEQMRPAYMGFQQLYPNVQRYMNQLINQGKGQRHPHVFTFGGRKLYCHKGHEYALLNYQIQGSAAEELKRGTIALDAAGLGPYIRLLVHDEIMLECPRPWARDMLAEATRILTNRTDYRVPITWSGNILEERWKKV